MDYKGSNNLPSVHQVILTCVHHHPGRFTRSELAKLLVGSKAARFADHSNLPEFGQLGQNSRKAITFEIDILLQQKYLSLDGRNKVTPGPLSSRDSAGDQPAL